MARHVKFMNVGITKVGDDDFDCQEEDPEVLDGVKEALDVQKPFAPLEDSAKHAGTLVLEVRYSSTVMLLRETVTMQPKACP